MALDDKLNGFLKKSAGICRMLICAVLLLLNAQLSHAQVPEVHAPSILCFDPAQPLPIADFVTLDGTGSDIISGMQISISSNYDPNTDQLSYTSGNGISGDLDATNGVLVLSGNASLDAYRQALRRVLFTTNATSDSGQSKTITASLSNLDFLVENGHFYQFVSDPGVSWQNARAEAQSRQLFGLNGYLATITTTAENQFILDRVSGTAWLGANDEDREGIFRWVTGPEGLLDGGLGLRVTDSFRNWDSGEPNDCCTNVDGQENFVHMMDWSSPPGRWNDLPNEGGSGRYRPTGFIVEFGGMPGEPNVVANIAKSTRLDFLQEIQIVGPISVCPNIQGVEYSVEALDGYTYAWVANGGVVASGQGTNTVTVNWGATNPNAGVFVTATSAGVCVSDTTLDVRINVQLEPPMPTGPDAICFADIPTAQTYSTPNTPGSNYNWQVTNGQVVSGNGTNEVVVLWDGPGIGQLFFTESTSTATDICDGDSPVLNVNLQQEIIPSVNISPVSCHGGSDGAVEITIASGTPPISYSWNTNGRGTPNGNSISGLPFGGYSVDITANGCTINVPIQINQPPALAGSIDVMDVLCFGDSTGTAAATVMGGTGDYTYQWSSNPNLNASSIGDLPAGNFELIVTDENDCVLTLDFSVTEPPLMVIDSIASTLVSCPEGSDGTLEAFVTGGTPPYSFTWEGSDDTGSLAMGFSQGVYGMTVTDANGCTASSSQEVNETTPRIFLPNAFSPNGDGMNDTFGPSTECSFDFQLTVYNRWGTPVFHTTDAAIRWDGTFEGKPAPTGNYSYSAAWVITSNNVTIANEKMGTLRLFR